jgi:CII-binding regulator of phage lambda lysogenization HflD
MENFKQIPGYKNYGISTNGEVKNLKTGLMLRAYLNTNYLRVNLCNDGVCKVFRIHQLMAITYLDHVPDGHRLVVDHINADRLDNRLDNLQIITNRLNASKDKVRDLPTGVYKATNTKYHARIYVDGKRRFLGSYNTPEKAHQAYLNAIPN